MNTLDPIFVSTSGIRAHKISDCVLQLANAGFTSIELSGGTKAYPELEQDLIDLKQQFALNYRCHNYFPPPDNNFVLNLSSQGDNFQRTISHLTQTIDLSERLGCEKLGIHCGFRIDPRVDELGNKISSRELVNFETAVKQFCQGFSTLNRYAKQKGVTLYVENNVISAANYASFSKVNPFLLTHYQEYLSLVKTTPFHLLLDVAHLKVSSHSLGLNFEQQLRNLITHSHYIHISDNNGLKDSNEPLRTNSELFNQLKEADLANKTFTLEVYSGIDDIVASYEALKMLMS